jgi:hypothetical protein
VILSDFKPVVLRSGRLFGFWKGTFGISLAADGWVMLREGRKKWLGLMKKM